MRNPATRSCLVIVGKFSSGSWLHFFQQFAESVLEARHNKMEPGDQNSLIDYACCYRKAAAHFCATCTRVFGFSGGNGDCHRSVDFGVDLDGLNAWNRRRRLDPSEITWRSLNTGLTSDMCVLAMTLEATGQNRKPNSQGKLQ